VVDGGLTDLRDAFRRGRSAGSVLRPPQLVGLAAGSATSKATVRQNHAGLAGPEGLEASLAQLRDVGGSDDRPVVRATATAPFSSRCGASEPPICGPR